MVRDGEAFGGDEVLLEDEEHDWVFGGAGAADPVAAGVELGPHGSYVVAHGGQDLGGVGLQHGEDLAGGGGEHCGERGAEGVSGGGDALVFDDFVGAGAEAAAGAEGAR